MKATTVLQPDPGSARAAREFVTAPLRAHARAGWPSTDLLDTAALLTSEVVTNAITHARSSVCLSVHLTDDRVRVVVRDRSGVHPEWRPGGQNGYSGRGLLLLERLATSWGVDPVAKGKAVWFELSR